MCWCGPESADGKNDAHRNGIHNCRHADFASWPKKGEPQESEQGDAFGEPRQEQQVSDAVDVRGLVCDEVVVADLRKEGIVHEVDCPHKAHHEPRRGSVDGGEISLASQGFQHEKELNVGLRRTQF